MSEERSSAPRPRIQGLSDLIFGLALSIGAIQLVGATPQTHAQLITALAAFAFSFLILINVWNRYTTFMSVVPVESTVMRRLNMLLLFLVAVEPYLFNLLVNQTVPLSLGQDVGAYYGLDIGAMNFVLAYFAHLLTREKTLLSPEMAHRFRVTRNAMLTVALTFTISAIPIFWTLWIFGIPSRFLIWILTVPLIWTSRILGKGT